MEKNLSGILGASEKLRQEEGIKRKTGQDELQEQEDGFSNVALARMPGSRRLKKTGRSGEPPRLLYRSGKPTDRVDNWSESGICLKTLKGSGET